MADAGAQSWVELLRAAWIAVTIGAHTSGCPRDVTNIGYLCAGASNAGRRLAQPPSNTKPEATHESGESSLAPNARSETFASQPWAKRGSVCVSRYGNDSRWPPPPGNSEFAGSPDYRSDSGRSLEVIHTSTKSCLEVPEQSRQEPSLGQFRPMLPDVGYNSPVLDTCWAKVVRIRP